MTKEKDTVNLETIVDLRNHALRTLIRLENGDVDVNEVGVIGKLYESVISSVKTELQYANMIGMKPKINFIEESATYTGELVPQGLALHNQNKEKAKQLEHKEKGA